MKLGIGANGGTENRTNAIRANAIRAIAIRAIAIRATARVAPTTADSFFVVVGGVLCG